ncbi:MAG: hypothetical protein OEV99_03300 [Nitrospira sp.]|nr:hypothetical protein [Nitrospira sp.]MDH4368847.1 hypothetical protein [Nitrospira sp.]MDH5496208.1 hypothetical protein [Nitrospira sp.]MDH5724103.1 hypothetical protein [Nitrospira sp.]
MVRVVALGASNLTRGFQTVVSTARSVWGPHVEVLAALGHGRSYGAPSRIIFRTLPGILRSGLWAELERRPPLATRGLVTDVGNDILYGFSVERTLGWVEETLIRLSRVTKDIVVTDLPLASISRLSNLKFLAFRSILVPSCRLSLAQVIDRSELVNEGLAKLAETYGAQFFRLDPAWYGFDPIHVRPSQWRPAWQKILGAQPQKKSGGSAVESVKLYFMRPERRWLFGLEQWAPQSGLALRSGGQVWLY